MPLIPDDRKFISTDVSSGSAENPGSAGMVPNAIANAGNTLTNVSLNLLEGVTRSEAIQASSKALLEDDFASQDMIRQLKTKYSSGYVTNDDGTQVTNPDGKPKTITQAYRDWANSRYEDNQSSMPSKMAQELYTQRAGQSFTDSMIKVRNDEFIQRTNSFKDDQAAQLMKGTNRLVDSPEVTAAYNLMDHLNDQNTAQKGTLLSADEVFRNRQMINKETPQSLFNGMITQVLANPKGTMGRKSQIDDAMSVLQGNDPVSQRRKEMGLYTISDSMDPDQKAHFEQRLMELQKVASAIDLSDLRQDTRNAVARIRQGDKVDVTPYVMGWGQALADTEHTHVTPFDFAENVAQLTAHQMTADLIRSPDFLLASPEVKNKMIAAVKNKSYSTFRSQVPPEVLQKFPSVGGSTVARIMSEVETVAGQADNLAKQDFATFSQFDQRVKTYSSNIDLTNPQTLWKSGATLKSRNDRIDTLGNTYFGGKSPDFKLLTKDESSNMGSYFKDPTVAYGTRADGLKALYNADPTHYGSVVNQMVKDNSLGAEFRIAPINANRQELQDYFRTVFDGQKIREDASKVAEAKGYKESDFDTAVQNAAGVHLQPMAMANTDSALREQERAQIRAVITTKAMDLYRQEGGAHDPSYYAQKATDTLLNSKQTPFSVGGYFEPGLRTQFLVPKFYGGRALSDEEQKNAVLNRNQFFRSPEGIKSTGAIPPAGTEDIDPKKFFEQVASTGALTPAEDGNGYNLKYYDRQANKYVSAMTSQRDRSGKPIPVYIPTSDLIRAPMTAPGKPKEEGKGFVQKLMDAFHFEAGY